MNKYKNIKTVFDGIEFASKKEAQRYRELKLLERCNQIAKLELQPKFHFELNGKAIFTYIADFRYFSANKAKYVIEDAKGYKTPLYRLKKKIIEAVYDIEIMEI